MKAVLLILLTSLAVLFLAVFQISFLNPSLWGLNLFLLLILFLILVKYDKSALFFSFIFGLFIDTNHFSTFGVSSLILVLLSFCLLIIYKTAFFTLKAENVIFMSLIAVILNRLLTLLTVNGLALLNRGSFENAGFYFLNFGFLSELSITAAASFMIFKLLSKKFLING